MGLSQIGTKDFLDVAVRADTALCMTDEQYDAYIEAGCPKDMLITNGPDAEPILFRLRKVLPYRLSLRLENMKMDMVNRKDGDEVTREMVPKMSFIPEEVRFSLVGILNPESCPEAERVEFKRDSESLCSDEILAVLMSSGSHMDLWRALQASKGKNKVADKKK